MHLLQPAKHLGSPIGHAIRRLNSLGNHQLPCQTSIRLLRQTRLQHNRPPRHSQSEPIYNSRTQRPHIRHDPDHIVHRVPGTDQYIQDINWEAARKRAKYLRTGIFAVVFSAGIFISAAWYQAKKELHPKPAPAPAYFRGERRGPIPIQEFPRLYWSTLDPISKLSIGIIGVNGANHLYGLLLPKQWLGMWHTPVNGTYRTLVSSIFVHGGFMHLGVNMWACYNFLLPVGYSKLFEGNPAHTLSFFLASGVLSSWAQHAVTRFENAPKALAAGRVPSIAIRSGGASGALFAVFGAFCMEYPNAGVGIILLPFSVAASSFLPFVMAFDAYGMVFGIRGLNLGHAAHLSGALLGVGYSYFDGKNKIWKPLVLSFKGAMEKK
ncbi:hypothetical protein B0J11DRAFT_457104 [Dendryphion nanum]|uniref:Peptidase S54 rhomboid domain-containing protein n=1 Tax=Dendryphion nanum TaxID=256645 RepID=A0A9P9E188_9PLEO|nr:hypothetical protein B0J11DRAFT_457104 [Dendryphion nanum]